MGKRRRGRGEGTVFLKKPGLWCAQATTLTGRHTLYGKTRREVVEKLAGVIADPSTPKPSAETVADYLDRWLEAARPALRATTVSTYTSLAKQITTRIGDERLGRLTPIHIQKLHAQLEADGVSATTRAHVHALLHRALGQAVRMGILRTNVCAAVDRPRRPRREMRALTTDEARRLLDAAKGDPLEALYVVAVSVGLRQGELFGLRWGDVNLKERSLSVRRTVVDVGGRVEFGETKTARGRRRVDLGDLAVQALREHRASLGAAPHPERLIFADSNGGPLRRPNFLRRSWRPLLERAELKGVRFHDLRHTAASLMLSAGIHPKVVQERLGHATVSITMDVYSHVLGTMQREAANKVDELLRRQ